MYLHTSRTLLFLLRHRVIVYHKWRTDTVIVQESINRLTHQSDRYTLRLIKANMCTNFLSSPQMHLGCKYNCREKLRSGAFRSWSLMHFSLCECLHVKKLGDVQEVPNCSEKAVLFHAQLEQVSRSLWCIVSLVSYCMPYKL